MEGGNGVKTKKAPRTWKEEKAREKKIRSMKAAVIAILLLAASVTTMVVLFQWEIRAFNVCLWFFGVIGFVRVMLLLVTWISDITISQSEEEPGFEQM